MSFWTYQADVEPMLPCYQRAQESLMWERAGECAPGWLDAPLPPVMLSSNGPSWGRTGFDEGNEPFGACRGSLFLFKKRATQQTPTTTLSSRWPPKTA